MSNTHIRRTRRSKLYMAPVLLDHSSMKRLIISMTLVLTVVFLSGYVTGFKKAEVKLAFSTETKDLVLPETIIETSALMEPVIPVLAAPGEMIDVDIADDESTAVEKPGHQMSQPDEVKSGIAVAVSVTGKVKPVALQKAGIVESAQAPAIGGPAATDPEQNEELLIQDTANEETASYTLQVGMYGQLENAEHRIEELVELDLSAYLTDYMNKKNEIRYNVRFGYFADRRSAHNALATFEKEFSGSGYIVRMPSLTNTSEKKNENLGS